MGRKLTDGRLLSYRKCVPQQLGDVIKQGSGDSRPMRARHGDTAANHNPTHFFGVVDWTLTHCFWSTGWEVISKFPSHSSLTPIIIFLPLPCLGLIIFNFCSHCHYFLFGFIYKKNLILLTVTIKVLNKYGRK